MSQEKLAEKAGIDSKFLSQIELGTRNPSLETIRKIASALDVPVKEVFDFEQFSGGIRDELHNLVQNLNEEMAQKAYRILKVLAE